MQEKKQKRIAQELLPETPRSTTRTSSIARSMIRRSSRPAAHLYQAFHGRPADGVVIRRVPRIVPPVVVHLGTLRGLIYRSDKWTPGRAHNFIHYMEDPPLLASNPQGTQLYILGGSYRVTPRGIEG